MTGRPTTAGRFAVARVNLWGHFVGAIAEDHEGAITFEYHNSFRRTGLEISPIHLPLTTEGPVRFPNLARLDAFAGLPGVFADALPDAFGNAVIERYFQNMGRPNAALSPVQKLLYLGDRAMGALEFEPALRARGPVIEEALEVRRLVDEARRVIEGDTAVAVPEIIQVGASAGGARAKALILWDRENGRVRSGFATPRDGEEPWIIKFDGASGGRGGPQVTLERRPGPFGRIEYAYSHMARRAGLELADTHLLEEGEYAHFMARRFDRVNGAKLHMHSLGGLQHVDYNFSGAFSYEGYFRTMLALGLGQDSLEQGFRRMVFNLAAANRDDHVKNVSFLMTQDGRWRLSPAFDVTYASGTGWTRTHQMTLAGKSAGFTREDLLSVADQFGLSQRAESVLLAVGEALRSWDDEARKVGVPQDWIDKVRDAFKTF